MMESNSQVISKLSDQLFEEWHEKLRVQDGMVGEFVRDGIVDMASFRDVPRLQQIVVMLSVAYSERKFEYLDFLREGAHNPPYDRPWNLLACWIYGIQQYFITGAFPAWETIPRDDLLALKKKTLRSIAIINAEKEVPRFKRPTLGVLKKAAERDRVYIREELKLIDPKLILLGGNKLRKIYEDNLFEFDVYLPITQNAHAQAWIDKVNERVIVLTYHPSSTTDSEQKTLDHAAWYDDLGKAIAAGFKRYYYTGEDEYIYD